MITLAQLISQLGAAGIKLWLDDEHQLRFKAPKGALTDSLKAELIAQKEQVIAFLAQSKADIGKNIERIARNPEQLYPLSYAQQRFWFLDKLEPGNPSLLMSAAFTIKGNLDIEALRQAFELTVSRHAILRTRFVFTEQQETRQHILPPFTWQLPVLENTGNNKNSLDSIIRAESLKPFDLHSPNTRTLLRSSLIIINNKPDSIEHVLLVSLHHIIADGWSLNLLIREVLNHYQKICTGNPESAGETSLGYIDFCEWQHQHIQRHYQQDIEFWKKQLHNVALLELPTDFQRPAKTTHNGSSVRFDLDENQSANLQKLASQLDVSLFSILLTAFYILLHKHSQQNDICIGIPVAGRHHQQVEDMAGCFINLLAIRNLINPESTAEQVIAAVHSSVLNAQQHQHTPFELVAEACTPQRSLAHTPLFQALFTQQTQFIQDFTAGDITFTLIPAESHTAKYDMQCHIDTSAKSFTGIIEYNTDLFLPDSANAFSQHYINIIHAIAGNHNAAIKHIDILSETEKQQMTGHQLEKPATKTLNALLDNGAIQYPGNTAVICGEQQITHLELHNKAEQLGRYLLDSIGAGTHQIGLFLPPGIDFMIAMLAIIKSGNTYVPIDINYPSDRIHHMINNAQMRMVISNNTLQERLPGNINTLAMENGLGKCSTTELPKNIAESGNLYLIYTSGSTGLPKGAGVSRYNEANLLGWYTNHYAMSNNDHVLIISALGFDLTQKNLLAPLCTGATIVFNHAAHFDPLIIRALIQKHNISWLNCAPSAFYPLTSDESHFPSLSSLKQLLFGGEPISITAISQWLNSPHCNAVISNMYGPTECTDITCAYSLDNPLAYTNKTIPIGKAIPGVTTYVLDSNLHMLPIGAVGELFIGGTGVGTGYFNQAELTHEFFINNPFGDGKIYRTRDLVRLIRNNGELLLEFIGRIDDQVKIRGYRIELSEISNQLSAHEHVQQALVIYQNEQLLAYYISKGAQATPAALRDFLLKKLPDFMIPNAYIAVSHWPLSANGKIDKKSLPAPTDNDRIKRQFIAAITPTQMQLAELWQTALNIKDIGISDNFFELGGHSLMATQLAGKIAQQFSMDLPLATFFNHPTIGEMADIIEQGSNIEHISENSISLADRSKPIPLSLAQERLWIIEQMSPGNAAYNIPFALRINGAIQPKHLSDTVYALVQRHESLRTRIGVSAEGLAFQDIRPASEFMLTEEHISPEAVQQRLEQFAAQTFKLSTDILFRAHIFKMNDNELILALCMHHLICDGWSLGILCKEFESAYHAISSGEAGIIPAPTIQYADYAVWQRLQAVHSQQQARLQFWLDELDNIPAHITLPTDKPRPAQQSFNGAIFTQPISAELHAKIEQLARQQGTTAYTIILTIYSILLGKYSRQSDICIGTPVSGRELQQTQQLIGYFVNAIVIRCRLNEHLAFKELLQTISNTVQQAFLHQDVAIELVLENLAIDRNPAYAPVAQVGFSYLNDALLASPALHNLDVAIIDINKVVSKYDITLIAEHREQLVFHWEYNTDLFHHDTIVNISQHFNHLIEQCLSSTSASVQELSLLDDSAICAAINMEPDNIEQFLPLTAMQHDMVMSQWINPSSLANTLGYRAEVDFIVDADKWEQAIELLAQTQPIMRTHFYQSRLAYGDFAYQAVLKQVDIECIIMDYRHESLSTDEIQKRVDAFIYQPAEYTRNQFIRYGIMYLAGPRSILLLSSHHALLDGISIVLIAEATARMYEALIARTPVHAVATPPAAFSNYISNINRLTDLPEVRNYWQQTLSHCSALDFPVDHQTTAPRQIVRVHYLNSTLWKNLKTYCKQQRTTPALLIKSLYCLLIANYCNATDNFYISEFNAGRDKSNADALGCYFTQSPFIFDIELATKEQNIQSLLNYARDYRKIIKPYDAISTGLTRQLAPQGRLHFMFNYYHFFPQNQLLQNHPITCIETPPFIDNTVQLVIKDKDNFCQLDIYYQDTIFNDLHLLERIESLCNQLVNGCQQLNTLSFILPFEQEQQLHTWNATEKPLPEFASIQQWFEHQAELTPDNIAIIDDSAHISFSELNTQSNRLAHYLQSLHLQPNTCIGLCFNRSINAIIALLAIIKAGHAYVPIDTGYPIGRIKHITETAHIQWIITELNCSDLFHSSDINCIYTDSNTFIEEKNKHPGINPAHHSSPDQLLYVIFTSGSTGKPKGAEVLHKGELNLLQWYSREFEFKPTSRNLVISALGFDLTQKNILVPLITGGTLVLSSQPHYDSGAIQLLIEKHQVTHINCAPSAFYPLIEDEQHFAQLTSLRTVIFGGEAINTNNMQPWLTHPLCNAELINNYGPTECTDISAFYRISDINTYLHKPIPIGKPNDNVQIYILNNQLQPLPTGVSGEICVAGEGVGTGYIHQAELSAEKFVANPFGSGLLYKTGDLGKYLPDGNIIFHTRKDHQIKLNGRRIELGEIEYSIKHTLNIADCLVTASDSQLIAYVISETPPAADWRQQLAYALPDYMIPQTLLTLQHWPLTPNGKIDRNALPKADHTVSTVEYIAPRNEIELFICTTISKILGVDRVGIHDNFFDLGGHSLAASRAIVQIREHFQMDIPLNVLFEMTTVEKLAAYIKATQWAQQSAAMTNDETRDTGFI